IPATECGGGLVRALQEFEQRFVRILRLADTIVGQQELTELLAVECPAGLHGRVLESSGRRVRIGIEGGIRSPGSTGPEAAAADLVGIRLARDPVGEIRNSTRMFGSASPREPRDRQIGRAPEEMDGAALSDEASPEELEDAIGLHERAPESIRVL